MSFLAQQQDRLFSVIDALGSGVIERIKRVGAFSLFFAECLRQACKPPVRTKLIFQQLEFIGNQSLSVILLTSFFTGAVFGLQIAGIFAIFKAEGLMGGATGKALARELAPLMTGFLLAGRAGSAMTAEIAIMKVNEQVDAMEAMAVDPIHYLVVPRIIASVLIMPFLCGIFMFVGVFGAYASGTLLFELDQGVFMEKLVWLVDPSDVWAGIQKMVVFALVIATIACRNGLEAKGGAKGVGVATTTSVVNALLMLLGFDFIISFIQITW